MGITGLSCFGFRPKPLGIRVIGFRVSGSVFGGSRLLGFVKSV